MHLMNRAMCAAIVCGAGMIPMIAVGASLPGGPVTFASVGEEQVSGTIASVGIEDDSFVIKDAAEQTHRVTTNEKTEYLLDGESATRSEVIAKGARVEAKVGDGIAIRVNRITD